MSVRLYGACGNCGQNPGEMHLSWCSLIKLGVRVPMPPKQSDQPIEPSDAEPVGGFVRSAAEIEQAKNHEQKFLVIQRAGNQLIVSRAIILIAPNGTATLVHLSELPEAKEKKAGFGQPIVDALKALGATVIPL